PRAAARGTRSGVPAPAARHFFSAPGTWPSTPLTKELMPPRNLSSALAPAATISLPSLLVIGPFQITKLPSFRPDFTVSSLVLTSAGTLSEIATMSIATSLTPHHVSPAPLH